jgi:hypothetical protein
MKRYPHPSPELLRERKPQKPHVTQFLPHLETELTLEVGLFAQGCYLLLRI